MRGKRDERTVYRLMLAASEVEPDDYRQAAVIGGIVRCFLETGHFNPNWVNHYVPQIMDWYGKCIATTGERPDFRRPTKDEVRTALKKLMDRYDPPTSERLKAA